MAIRDQYLRNLIRKKCVFIAQIRNQAYNINMGVKSVIKQIEVKSSPSALAARHTTTKKILYCVLD
jgi:hypothetical protein